MSAQPQLRLMPEQYLEIERAAEFRSEYHNGRMCMMSGGSFPHGQIIGNLTTQLALALQKRPCSVIPKGLREACLADGSLYLSRRHRRVRKPAVCR